MGEPRGGEGEEEDGAFLSRCRFEEPLTSADPESGFTPLHYAVVWGGSHAVARLLAQKADVNAVTTSRCPIAPSFAFNTPLTLAAQFRAPLRTFELLLDARADPNVMHGGNMFNVPALMYAADVPSGITPQVRLLLDRKANVHLAGPSGDTALSMVGCSGNQEVAEELLSRGAGTPPDGDHVSYFGRVSPLDDALGVACWMGRPAMARFLLERKATRTPRSPKRASWSPSRVPVPGRSFDWA